MSFDLLKKRIILLISFVFSVILVIGIKADLIKADNITLSQISQTAESKDEDLAELLRLHKQQKTAHLTYNAGLFVEMFNDPITQIQNGNIMVFSKEQSLNRFKKYFASVKFQEWSDIAPPVVKISKDGTLATMTVSKRVRAMYKNEKGEEESDHSIFAWLTIWEKIEGKWKVVTIASTAKYGKDEK